MSALYVMRYLGAQGVGFGSIYVGKGVVLGIDVANGRYKGTYTEAGGRVKVSAQLIAPPFLNCLLRVKLYLLGVALPGSRFFPRSGYAS